MIEEGEIAESQLLGDVAHQRFKLCKLRASLCRFSEAIAQPPHHLKSSIETCFSTSRKAFLPIASGSHQIFDK